MTAADAHDDPAIQVIAPGSDDHFLLDAAFSAQVQPWSLPHAISASRLWKVETRWIEDSLNVSASGSRPRFALRVTTPASVATTVMVTDDQQLLHDRARQIAQEWVNQDQIDAWSAKNLRITPKRPGLPAPPTKPPATTSHAANAVIGALSVAAVLVLVVVVAWLLFSIASQPAPAPAQTEPLTLDDDQIRSIVWGLLWVALAVGSTMLLIREIRR
ncbi:hypothetical protein [Glycomyces sp. NPDC047010]|uniref:hypothetical protein n=1 Tax=Glycomyces sp. NPDC047010 TaxID=3155023 RepID=UPI0033FD8F5A